MINEPSNSPRTPSPARDQFEFDGLSLIRTSQASALHRGDMNKDVLAATLRLDEAVAFGGVEPSYGTCRHLLRSSIAVAAVIRGANPAASAMAS
jgi:hypothetical protein